jgi:hypothetical protein
MSSFGEDLRVCCSWKISEFILLRIKTVCRGSALKSHVVYTKDSTQYLSHTMIIFEFNACAQYHGSNLQGFISKLVISFEEELGSRSSNGSYFHGGLGQFQLCVLYVNLYTMR